MPTGIYWHLQIVQNRRRSVYDTWFEHADRPCDFWHLWHPWVSASEVRDVPVRILLSHMKPKHSLVGMNNTALPKGKGGTISAFLLSTPSRVERRLQVHRKTPQPFGEFHWKQLYRLSGGRESQNLSEQSTRTLDFVFTILTLMSMSETQDPDSHVTPKSRSVH